MELKYKTRSNDDPFGKPRVYFCCHPEDFEKYFKEICDNIFKTHDCAFYYTQDMESPILIEDKETILERNNLFVVPVTFKLLTTPNRAMDDDIPFARERNIPILPIIMESGIEEFYSAPDKFGELQYLNPQSCDSTEISYLEKLKKYLDSVLISDKTAERIRAEFDAYIFLSYRKKDRRYANELMRIIHSNPELRDVAVWFDEFLTPGESFKENISRFLNNSKLFALLVTPNVLEEPDGKPNFVMGEEYPAALKSGLDILPAEMENTDKDALNAKFEGIPVCVDPHNYEAFKERLLKSILKFSVRSNNTPEHKFLIGLAYLEGIDVEVDRRYGIELITEAAKDGLLEAMQKLYTVYNEGQGVPTDYREAIKWATCIVEHYKKNYGEHHPDTLTLLAGLAVNYENLGEHQKALELKEKAYDMSVRVRGKEHPDTLRLQNTLAATYGAMGDFRKALELTKEVYELRCKVLGEEDKSTLNSLSDLALCYSDLGEYRKALELNRKAYELSCKILGETHPDTLITLSNTAAVYNDLREYEKSSNIARKVYLFYSKTLGAAHPKTLNALNNLAVTYVNCGKQQGLELSQGAFKLRNKILGEIHPDTLRSLESLASCYMQLGHLKEAYVLYLKLYSQKLKVYGKEHKETLKTLALISRIQARLKGNA